MANSSGGNTTTTSALFKKLTPLQRDYYKILALFFDNTHIAYEIALFFGVTPKFGNYDIPPNHTNTIKKCLISKFETFIITCCGDTHLRIWDTVTGTCIRVIENSHTK